MQTAKSSAASTSMSTKQPNSTFNFITAVLRDFTTKKLSMRDALKRFNSEIEKHGGDSSLPTEQFADILCRFIRGENFGDLWFVLKQSAKKSTGQEALLSGAERHFFEFVYDLNSNDNGERWSGIFLKLAQTLCSDCERSSASSFIQKCQDVRVMMCALFFSDQHEKADETERLTCIKQINALVDRLVDEDDASTVVRVLCFIYTTNGNFLFHQFLNLATMPITRMQRIRQHLANSPADANTFFALIQKDIPENLVEALRQPLEQKFGDNVK
ncbi:hypothetical protein M3Y97_00459200 [Aphelenchoides bicaudatus]|nr:hypothetical protein M3Y97_00459200 [Aphelenchoides bicaudatus]